jgi:hypothetical protein
MGIAYNPRTITDGLVLCLDAANSKSYPGSGTTWTDLSGLGNTGTLVNGVGYSGDNLGSLSFDGSNDRVELSSNAVGNENQFTIDIWYKRGSQTDRYLYSESRNSSPNPFWGITSHTGSSSAQLRIYARNDSGTPEMNFQPSGSEYAIYDNQIHHLVVVYQSNTLYFYLDGSSIGNTTWNKGSYSNADLVTIGGFNGNANTGGHMLGNIYSVKTFGKALTPQEIQQNYNATKSRYI